MAASTVITSDILTFAGITDAGIVATLTGKTIAQAADLYLTVIQLAIVEARRLSKDMVSYSLERQNFMQSMDEAVKLVAFIRRMMSSGGGPVAMGVQFGSP